MNQALPPRRSRFADAAAAQEAVALALPMIEAAVRDERVSGAGFLCIVVLDPGVAPGQGSFDDAVLVEHAVGGRERWDADYAAFARAKAKLAWQTGLDTQALQAAQPHRLAEGDTLLAGAVCLDGIVVAVSGAFPWWDEAFATAVAANLRAIAKRDHAQAREQGRLTA